MSQDKEFFATVKLVNKNDYQQASGSHILVFGTRGRCASAFFHDRLNKAFNVVGLKLPLLYIDFYAAGYRVSESDLGIFQEAVTLFGARPGLNAKTSYVPYNRDTRIPNGPFYVKQ